MNKEIPLKLIVETVSNEKGVSEEVLFAALEAALVSATKKKDGMDIEVRVAIDRKTGLYETFRVWKVVADPEINHPLENPYSEITLSAAQIDNPDIKVGDTLEKIIESVEFGRIAAQCAKQVIIQKVREAERDKTANEYRARIGEILISIVKKTTRDCIIVDISSTAEGFIRRDNILPREAYRPGDRIKACLVGISDDSKGPQLILSRTCNGMLEELFKIEVPEVGEGIIEIKGTARDAGVRAKIAVKTNDGRMDPVGACVGMRGARVQAVSNELSGERIDIILWDENPAKFVMNAMAPAEIVSMVVDEETRTMDLAVGEEYLSQAIGRGGQNVKLASELTKWKLNVLSASDAQEKVESETEQLVQLFVEKLHVDTEVAELLVEEGFTSLEEVAYVPIQEMLEIDGFDEEIVNDLRGRAKDTLANQERIEKSVIETVIADDDLLAVAGVDSVLATMLSNKNIKNREELAELAIEELTSITGLSEEQAGKIIMAARAHWFAN
jgi:N utilization substance protein A